MPITQSAKKALRQNKRRHARNLTAMRTLRETVKTYRKTPVAQSLAGVYQKLDKAAKNNLIAPNKAARLKSRLARMIAKKEK